MIDPRKHALLDRDNDFLDKTPEVVSYRVDDRVWVAMQKKDGATKEYSYSSARMIVMQGPQRIVVDHAGGDRIEVCGSVCAGATELWQFDGPAGVWFRVFWQTDAGESYRIVSHDKVRVLSNAANGLRSKAVFDFWREVIAELKEDDPFHLTGEDFSFVHPESALAQYAGAEPISLLPLSEPLIFPFSFNASQRDAVEQSLTHSLSVIDGPPGTGKTQAILNIIANIVATPGRTVGVVSSSNAAVENVREKLEKARIGCAVAALGNAGRRSSFFAERQGWDAAVAAMVAEAPTEMPDSERLVALDARLRELQLIERRLAQNRNDADAYRLEQSHFERLVAGQQLPSLDGLPLLRRSAERILDYIAETEFGTNERGVRSLIHQVRNYFRYGSTRGVDMNNADAVLRLQRGYYAKKLDELEIEIDRDQAIVELGAWKQIPDEHMELSRQWLFGGLRQRYSGRKAADYAANSYKGEGQFSSFVSDYPVILSTCHSLRNSIRQGYLLDYLIIDEASMVNLLTAGLALACCRNLIVVGDLKQLPQIVGKPSSALVAVATDQKIGPFNYYTHNILSSLIALYGSSLPRTMLREHYRCDAAIIEFCNRAYYDGQLIPYRVNDPAARPLVLVRTAEGNHMRKHAGGGNSNQREVDVIASEVLPRYCAGISDDEIGVTTPYRRQVDKVDGVTSEEIEVDTVHKFQGREKDVVIMTTVLDESDAGHRGISFVDDPHLVNVAVSRAKKRFILVTDHAMLPRSRNLRDLVGYIRYRDPDALVDSSIVSVFDLLYREYSQRLSALAARRKNEMRYPSEGIIWTVLRDILAEEPYGGLTVSKQIHLRTLVRNPSQLGSELTAYVKHRASIDFVIYSGITTEAILAIEVDGFAFHENNPKQLERDAKKNAILAILGLPLLRLPTTGSGEEERIRSALDAALGFS